MNKKKFSPEPGKRIRECREKAGVTRAQFEEMTGVSASTLRYFETGQREVLPIKARLISNMFIHIYGQKKITPEYLLYGVEEENPDREEL